MTKPVPMNNYSKDAEDHFDTPSYAADPLALYLKPCSTVWECTDTRGTSGITRALRNHGHRVIENCNRAVDFNNDEATPEFMHGIDYIITNPPFNNKDEFIESCLFYSNKYPHIGWAMLMPTTAISGIRRCKAYSMFDLQLLVLDRRIDYTGSGATWFASIWYCCRVLPKQVIIHQLVNCPK